MQEQNCTQEGRHKTMTEQLEKPKLTQINVRIDSQLKAEGDAVLATAGITPTQAVRAIWTLAANAARTPNKLNDVLFPEKSESAAKTKDSEMKRRAKIIEAGSSICNIAYEKMGIEPHSAAEKYTYEELKAAAYLEYAKRMRKIE